jgi:uncharacterized membrane protein YidH (DUF202 family)
LVLQLVRVINNCLGEACKLFMFHLEIFVLLTELVCEAVLPAVLCAGKMLSLQKNSIRWSKVHHQMEKKLKVLELQEAMILGF